MSRPRIILPSDRVTVPPRGRFQGGTDPASAPRYMLPRQLMDTAAHRNLGNPEIPMELPALPDDRLVAVMVEHGCPVWSANELRRSGFLRFCAVRFFFDVMDAQEGDRAARERVDFIREQYQEMRRAGIVDETPSHTVGIFER